MIEVFVRPFLSGFGMAGTMKSVAFGWRFSFLVIFYAHHHTFLFFFKSVQLK